MRVQVPLLLPARTRAGWVALGLVCGSFSAAGLWVGLGIDLEPLGRALSFAMALGYGWLADGAVRLGLARPATLSLGDGGVCVRHGYLLAEPIEVGLDAVEGVGVDLRPHAERRIAAGTRGGPIAPASFVDPRIPVVSALPSSHWDGGTLGAPNVVLWLGEDRSLPSVPRAARVLLRISVGRSGRYRGPRPKRPFRAVRLAVPDEAAAAVAEAASRHGRLVEVARDRRYLSPVTEANRRRYRRDKVLMVGVVAAVGLFVLAARIA